uniref:PH domain-containing protein n=1 Tax=Mesocestoides corti TaxID=53468 RepID=A0A5K3F750_MESCO
MHRRLVDIHLRALSHLPLFLSPLMPIQEQGSPLATHLQCHHRLWQTTVPQPSLLVLRWADPHTGSHHRRRSRITLATSPQHPVRYPRAPVMATPSPKPHSSPTCSTKKANPTPLSTKTENRKKEVEEGRSRSGGGSSLRLHRGQDVRRSGAHPRLRSGWLGGWLGSSLRSVRQLVLPELLQFWFLVVLRCSSFLLSVSQHQRLITSAFCCFISYLVLSDSKTVPMISL